MKLRIIQYDLICHNGEYEALVELLSGMSISQQVNKNGWEYFVMPEGTVKISLMDKRSYKGSEGNLEGRVLMGVTRTTRKEPEYVKKIIERLSGKLSGQSTFTPEELVDLYLAENYGRLLERKRN